MGTAVSQRSVYRAAGSLEPQPIAPFRGCIKTCTDEKPANVLVWTASHPNGFMTLTSKARWEERSMKNTPIRIGMDTSKSVFQLHGVNSAEEVVVRRQFRRAEMMRYFEKLPPTLVAIESCGSSHHWARLLLSFGHDVKLIPPQYVKPYVKRGKNDAADAEALCEAVTRPSMRFVPVKSKEQQAACMLMTVRERLVCVKSQLSNAFPQLCGRVRHCRACGTTEHQCPYQAGARG